MKVISILVACLVLWTAPVPTAWWGPALAQEPPAMTGLKISLWPEYDEPALLVMYRGQFAADSSLPLPVEFRIPAEVGRPYAVAFLDEQDQPHDLDYTTRLEGDWLVVVFDLPAQGFQLEYYAPLPGSPAPGQRTFTYTYRADYALATLDLEVQEPLGTQGFKLEPPADSVVQEADGLNYHLATAGPLDQNDTVTWSVSYEKTRSGLTADASQPKGVSGILIAVLSLIALAAVGVGGFWLGRRSRPVPPPAAPGKRRRGGQRRRPGPSTTQDTGFCYQCGTRLRPDVDFCHQCGAAVRKS